MKQVERYLTFLKQGRQLADNTVKAARNDFKQFKGDLENATRFDVEDFIMEQNKSGLSSSTLSRRISNLKNFFEWQIYNGLRVGLNPAEGKITPKVVSEKRVPIEYDQLVRLYTQAPTDNLKVAIALGGYAGLRISEIYGIGDHNTLYTDDNGQLAVSLTKCKGGKDRNVSLGLVPDKDLIINFFNNGGFKGERGKLSQHGLWRQLRAYFDKKGMEDFSPHALRTTFKTIAVKNDIRIDVQRDMMGHTTINGNNVESRYVGLVGVEEQFIETVGKWGC